LIKAQGKIISKNMTRDKFSRNETTLIVDFDLQNGIPLRKLNIFCTPIKTNLDSNTSSRWILIEKK